MPEYVWDYDKPHYHNDERLQVGQDGHCGAQLEAYDEGTEKGGVGIYWWCQRCQSTVSENRVVEGTN